MVGLKSDIIDVEVDIGRGLHSFSIVGLPDKAVEEARDRISAAIKNSGFKSPQKGNHKVIVSLAPADIKKEGPVFDLGIAIAYLLAARDMKFDPAGKIFIGELSLDGTLRPVKGVLLMTKEAKKRGFREIYLPRENAPEAALIEGIKVYPCVSLKRLIEHLDERKITTEDGAEKPKLKIISQTPTKLKPQPPAYAIDLSDVKGQETAKRGLEIAAAGGHNIAMYGPPGTGKTMLAKAFISILPPLQFDEALEATGIHSAAGILDDEFVTNAPLRSPHHTSSYVSMVGGGAYPRPGEITLAHRGVLFLDEFPEFERRVIESLRQPLEDRIINIARAKGSMRFPASFILIATMNPCPCGNRGLKDKECICSQGALMKYQRKISGPIIDRIDLWLDVPHIPPEKLSDHKNVGAQSHVVKGRIIAARSRQLARQKKLNNELGVKDLKTHAPLTDACTQILNNSATRMGLSARAYHRVIKLARTIADLEGAPAVADRHLFEALQYRPRQEA